MFLDELRHFIQVIQGQAVPVCKLEDGIKAIQLALTATLTGKI